MSGMTALQYSINSCVFSSRRRTRRQMHILPEDLDFSSSAFSTSLAIFFLLKAVLFLLLDFPCFNLLALKDDDLLSPSTFFSPHSGVPTRTDCSTIVRVCFASSDVGSLFLWISRTYRHLSGGS